MGGEWPSGLYSLCQVTEVKLGRVKGETPDGWPRRSDLATHLTVLRMGR